MFTQLKKFLIFVIFLSTAQTFAIECDEININYSTCMKTDTWSGIKHCKSQFVPTYNRCINELENKLNLMKKESKSMIVIRQEFLKHRVDEIATEFGRNLVLDQKIILSTSSAEINSIQEIYRRYSQVIINEILTPFQRDITELITKMSIKSSNASEVIAYIDHAIKKTKDVHIPNFEYLKNEYSFYFPLPNLFSYYKIGLSRSTMIDGLDPTLTLMNDTLLELNERRLSLLKDNLSKTQNTVFKNIDSTVIIGHLHKEELESGHSSNFKLQLLKNMLCKEGQGCKSE